MKEGKGFLTFAFNSQDTNYLDTACYLAKSIKQTQVNNSVALVMDQDDSVDETLFDHVIKIPRESKNNDYRYEALALKLSPYKQTIKIESDMILTASIDHWWDILDQKNVVLTNKVETYNGQEIRNRSQRKLFDENNLPDTYSGFYYFRYSKEAVEFFNLVNQVFNDWYFFRDQVLQNCRKAEPVTDEVFAIAAKIWGIEKCTLNNSIPSFVHMKNILQDLPSDDHWWNYKLFEKNIENINIGFFSQHLPLHYQDKKFIEILRKYYD